MKNKFESVNPEWITKQLKKHKKTREELADGVNVSVVQIHNWLSGNRNPSGAAMAAIYYYFIVISYKSTLIKKGA
jgi:transcriptional regulator with XRE-family HTH domain